MASRASHVHVQVRAYRPRVSVTDDCAAACRQLRGAVERINFSEASRRVGMDRTALHRALSDRRGGRMNLTTFAAIAEAVGLRLVLVDESHAL